MIIMPVLEAMNVTYNGVLIRVAQVQVFERRPVYSEDKTQILYDHWHIGVVGKVNPFATTSTPGVGQPLTNAGAALRPLGDTLMAQRKQLLVTYGTSNNQANGSPNVILQSPRQSISQPATAYTVDDRFGPNPIAWNVIEIHGTHTLTVYFEIETWQQKCTSGNAVLYHRWEASHDIDENYMTTRNVKGRAIFSPAVLLDPNVAQTNIPNAPDDFREALFHGRAIGMQRGSITVTADMDGTGVTYSFEDVEQYTNLRAVAGNRGIIKVEGTHHSGWDITTGMLPGRHVVLEATVYGLRTTARVQLVNALEDIAATYGFLNPSNAGWWQAGELSVDIAKKQATLMMRMQISGLTNFVPRWFPVIGAPANAGLRIGLGGANAYPEDLAPPWAVNVPTQCISPTNSRGTRGTYLERLVAQALSADCAFPASAPASYHGSPLVQSAALPYYPGDPTISGIYTGDEIKLWTW